MALLEAARAAGLSTLLSTGLAWEDVQMLSLGPRVLRCVDALLVGRYVAERRVAHGLLGSANQTVHLLSPRHTHEEIAATPEAEAVILPEGFNRSDPAVGSRSKIGPGAEPSSPSLASPASVSFPMRVADAATSSVAPAMARFNPVMEAPRVAVRTLMRQG